MMKRILAASAAFVSVAAMTSTASAAPTTGAITDSITVTGQVAAICSVQNDLGTVTVALPQSLANSDGTLNTGALSSENFDFGTVWCNGAHSTFSVAATAFTNPVANPDTTDFTNKVNYTVTGKIGSTTIGTIDTAGTSSITNAPVGIFLGDVTATGAADTDTHKLVAGTYTATLTATLTPGV